jgi:hypothetical protein
LLRKTFFHNAVCLLQGESSHRCPIHPLHVGRFHTFIGHKGP